MRRFCPRSLSRALLAALFLAAAALSAAEFTVRVKVYDQSAGKAIADATVVVLETKQKYFTDASGFAVVTVPAAGFYTFRAILSDGRLVQPRLEIKYTGQELTIFTGKDGGGGPDKGPTGEQVVTDRGIVVSGEVKRIPGTFGEALRGLESLPGVNAPSFGSGEIVVRGANQNANTYLVDDLPIGYAFHIFPLDSVLHNDIIKSMDLYTGAYPANYGNATGGVISIETIDKVEKFGGHASFSLFSTKALFKGPLLGDNTGYWIGSGRYAYLDQTGRYAYLDQTLKPYIPDGIRPPQYWDSQFKMEFRPTKTHTLYVYALAAKDSFGAKVKNSPAWDPTTDIDPIFIGAHVALDQAFHTEAVRDIWQPTSTIQNRLTLYNHSNIFYVDGSIGTLSAKERIENGWVALKDETSWEAVKNHVTFDAGVEGRVFFNRINGNTPRILDPNNPSPNFYDTNNPAFVTVPVHDSERTSYNNAYAMATIKGMGFNFKPGVRLDYFGLTKQQVVDPRGTLSYETEQKTMVTAGAGIYHRVPLPNEYSASSGNPDLKMERAEHYALGLQQIFKRWTFKAEVYKHYYTDIVVADPYAVTPIRKNTNPYQQYSQPYLFNDRLGFTNDGTGYSDGYEIYIKNSKPEAEPGWYGWISYTWSRSFRNNHQHVVTDAEKTTLYSADERRIINQYDNTKDYYADFDRTQIINVIFGYKFNRDWQLGARWKYMTSAPFTPIINDDGAPQSNGGRPIFNPVYSAQTNSGRLKPYHRLDIRVDRFFNYEWGFGNVFVEIINAYIRDNPTGQDWSRSEPVSRTNPSIQYDFGSLNIPAGPNRVVKSPLFNVGVEVQF
ncbi:MAG: TonB-dependent receptor [Spirochaetia bacterium]|nr:TonB-dependent receptor [Spirochaetia bacterium]